MFFGNPFQIYIRIRSRPHFDGTTGATASSASLEQTLFSKGHEEMVDAEDCQKANAHHKEIEEKGFCIETFVQFHQLHSIIEYRVDKLPSFRSLVVVQHNGESKWSSRQLLCRHKGISERCLLRENKWMTNRKKMIIINVK